MPSDAHPRRSFLTATLVSCIFYCCGAFANTVIVDDQHLGLVWDGAWEEFTGQQEAEDGTLTWANRTGPTVTLTFTGTSVQVFGAFKPVGTWNIQSLYAIDGGKQTAFVPSPLVPQESSKQKFYDSGPLPLGTHTLKITNLGVQLWIDYFAYDDGGGSGQSTSSLDLTAASTNQIGGTKTTTPATRPSPSSSVAGVTASASSFGIGSAESGAIVPSTSLAAGTSSQLSTTVSATGSLLTPDAASSGVLTLPQSSPLLTSSSLNVTATPGGSQTPRPNTHGMPHGALVGLIVGAAVVVVAIVGVLIRLRRRHLRRTPREVRVSQYPFVRTDHGSGSTLRARESQSSKTLSVGLRSCSKSLQIERRLSAESGVSAAGGARAADADVDARLVSDAVSEESTPPPSYREFEHGAP